MSSNVCEGPRNTKGLMWDAGDRTAWSSAGLDRRRGLGTGDRKQNIGPRKEAEPWQESGDRTRLLWRLLDDGHFWCGSFGCEERRRWAVQQSEGRLKEVPAVNRRFARPHRRQQPMSWEGAPPL